MQRNPADRDLVRALRPAWALGEEARERFAGQTEIAPNLAADLEARRRELEVCEHKQAEAEARVTTYEGQARAAATDEGVADEEIRALALATSPDDSAESAAHARRESAIARRERAARSLAPARAGASTARDATATARQRFEAADKAAKVAAAHAARARLALRFADLADQIQSSPEFAALVEAAAGFERANFEAARPFHPERDSPVTLGAEMLGRLALDAARPARLAFESVEHPDNIAARAADQKQAAERLAASKTERDAEAAAVARAYGNQPKGKNWRPIMNLDPKLNPLV